MTTIESITASYTIKGIFGRLEDVETSADGPWITKRLITKLVAGIFRPYWEQGHVNSIKVELSDGRVLCIQKSIGGDKHLDVTEWKGAYSSDTHTFAAKAVSADLRSMVVE